MRESLQEQLMKAGLVKDKSANKKRTGYKKNKKKAAKPKPVSEPKPRVLADNELPKETKLEIKKILKENSLNDKEGDSPFNYTVGNQVKRCYVSAEQLKKIQNGEIVIINWNDRSYLLPLEILYKLKELHPFLRFFYIQDSSSDTDDVAYQEHPVPDDLHW